MENIHVVLRVRPLNSREKQLNDISAWAFSSYSAIQLKEDLEQELVIKKRITTQTKTQFFYDYCFNDNSSNSQVYETSIRKVVMSSLNGINGTVFMYGQTGSGKTFTMLGANNIDNQTSTLQHQEESKVDSKTQSPNRKRSRTESRRESYLTALEHTPKEIMQDNFEGNTYGILVLSLKELFKTIEEDLDKTFVLHCSYVEIYNDSVFDLLAPRQKFGEVLIIAEDTNKEFYIKGVTEESVSSIDEILEKLKKGENNRHYAKTVMNHCSSRSHTVFRLHVQTITNTFIRNFRRERRESNINNHNIFSLKNPEDKSQKEGTFVTESLLNFVDLAGSERASTHSQLSLSAADGIVKDRVNESKHINKSLFYLCQVISLKSENKATHIPYRNSPLTKILRSSLGGNSRTLVMLCITPALSQIEHSMSTLRFGLSAKKIENNIHANIKVNNDDEAVRLLLNEYEKKLRELEDYRRIDKAKIVSQEKENKKLGDENNKLKERLKKLQRKFFDRNFCHASIKSQKENFDASKVGIIFHTSKTPVISKEKQDKIYDYQGKYALAALKSCKEKLNIEEEKSKTYSEERNQWKYSCVFKKRQLIEMKSILRKKEEQIKELNNLFQETMGALSKVYKRESMFSSLKSIEEMDNETLRKLEKHFYAGLERIKSQSILKVLNKSLEEIPQSTYTFNLEFKDDSICNDELISSLSSRFSTIIERKVETSITKKDIDEEIEKKFRLKIESLDAKKGEIAAVMSDINFTRINEMMADGNDIDRQLKILEETLQIPSKMRKLEETKNKVQNYLEKCQKSREKWMKNLDIQSYDKFSQKLLRYHERSQSMEIATANEFSEISIKRSFSCNDLESEILFNQYAFMDEDKFFKPNDDYLPESNSNSVSLINGEFDQENNYDVLTPMNLTEKFFSNFRDHPSPVKKLIEKTFNHRRSTSMTRSINVSRRNSSVAVTPISNFIIPEILDDIKIEDSPQKTKKPFAKHRNKSVSISSSMASKYFSNAFENYKENNSKLAFLKRGRK